MNEKDQMILRLKLTELNSVWQEYCESHNSLYDLTCDEYMHLLSSDIEALEETLETKNEKINYIKTLEDKRVEVLAELNQLSGNIEIKKIGDVLELSKVLKDQSETKRLEKFNLLLLDIVEKIQDQNKLNQLFLNKAIHSLRDLKESFSGRKTFKTYGSNGVTKNNNTSA
jgi:flagellar biosynthesis/type III secretory pathway chaperone